jgi:hypothetical protein
VDFGGRRAAEKLKVYNALDAGGPLTIEYGSEGRGSNPSRRAIKIKGLAAYGWKQKRRAYAARSRMLLMNPRLTAPA